VCGVSSLSLSFLPSLFMLFMLFLLFFAALPCAEKEENTTQGDSESQDATRLLWLCKDFRLLSC